MLHERMLGESLDDYEEKPIIVLFWLAEVLRMELAYQTWLDYQQVNDNGLTRRSKFIRYLCSGIPINKEIRI